MEYVTGYAIVILVVALLFVYPLWGAVSLAVTYWRSARLRAKMRRIVDASHIDRD